MCIFFNAQVIWMHYSDVDGLILYSFIDSWLIIYTKCVFLWMLQGHGSRFGTWLVFLFAKKRLVLQTDRGDLGSSKRLGALPCHLELFLYLEQFGYGKDSSSFIRWCSSFLCSFAATQIWERCVKSSQHLVMSLKCGSVPRRWSPRLLFRVALIEKASQMWLGVFLAACGGGITESDRFCITGVAHLATAAVYNTSLSFTLSQCKESLAAGFSRDGKPRGTQWGAMQIGQL